jgi:copper chaperone CopZ
MLEIVFKVEMACSGCSGAVTKILSKAQGNYFFTIHILYTLYFLSLTLNRLKILGVESVETNLDTQLVKAFCADNTDPKELFKVVEKWGSATGKKVELVEN